jgi:outer membrane murein-binding lipoprotein Lpp
MDEKVLDDMEKSKSAIWIIVFAVVLSSAVFGGGIYWFQNEVAKIDRGRLESQISVLELKLKNLEDKIPTTTTSAATSATTTTTTATATVDPTADWMKMTLLGIDMSIKFPESFGTLSLPKSPTTEDPSYFYNFSAISNDNVAFATGNVTAGRGGSAVETYFQGSGEPTVVITKNGATIGGIYIQEASNQEDCMTCSDKDLLFAVYYKTGSMYSNIVVELPDSAANRTIAENMIKSIAAAN